MYQLSSSGKRTIRRCFSANCVIQHVLLKPEWPAKSSTCVPEEPSPAEVRSVEPVLTSFLIRNRFSPFVGGDLWVMGQLDVLQPKHFYNYLFSVVKSAMLVCEWNLWREKLLYFLRKRCKREREVIFTRLNCWVSRVCYHSLFSFYSKNCERYSA